MKNCKSYSHISQMCWRRLRSVLKMVVLNYFDVSKQWFVFNAQLIKSYCFILKYSNTRTFDQPYQYIDFVDPFTFTSRSLWMCCGFFLIEVKIKRVIEALIFICFLAASKSWCLISKVNIQFKLKKHELYKLHYIHEIVK